MKRFGDDSDGLIRQVASEMATATTLVDPLADAINQAQWGRTYDPEDTRGAGALRAAAAVRAHLAAVLDAEESGWREAFLGDPEGLEGAMVVLGGLRDALGVADSAELAEVG